jgi:hypothetical protein
MFIDSAGVYILNKYVKNMCLQTMKTKTLNYLSKEMWGYICILTKKLKMNRKFKILWRNFKSGIGCAGGARAKVKSFLSQSAQRTQRRAGGVWLRR